MRQLLIALIAGLIFGMGLVVSGMASPVKVLAFLRLGNGWDPSLGIVMGGALLVTIPGFAWWRRKDKATIAPYFPKPSHGPIDYKLVIGALLFGMGWGLAGYCPGPAIVAGALLQKTGLLFLPSMLVGGWLSRYLLNRT